MNHSMRAQLCCVAVKVFVALFCIQRQTAFAAVTWIAGSGNWTNPANWSPAQAPTTDDDVFITNSGASVLLSSNTSNLNSLVLSKTLVFTNWNTTLYATNVTIQNGGLITLPVAYTNSVMSNNVYIVCSNLVTDSGGRIDVDGKGYKGAPVGYPTYGNGPGYGGVLDGADHGGLGGDYLGYQQGARATYGSVTAPVTPGSGGGGQNAGTGGDGGGAVRIEATEGVTVNGTISAGGLITASGGGSGGSIYITCLTLSGTGGVVRAEGGGGWGGLHYSGGGGGRIAVIYNQAAQAAIAVPDIRFSVAGGLYNTGLRNALFRNNPVGYPSQQGDIGSLYFPDNRFLATNMIHSGEWDVGGLTNWSAGSLTMSNAWIRFPWIQDMYITNHITVTGTNAMNCHLELRNARLTCGGDITLTNSSLTLYSSGPSGSAANVSGDLNLNSGSRLYVYSGVSNALGTNYGALVAVGGDFFVRNNAKVHPYPQLSSTSSPLFRAQRVTIEQGGKFDAYTAGYLGGKFGSGPGSMQANYFEGGSHGGRGGTHTGYAAWGNTYGNSNAPVMAGMGAGANAGANLFSGGGDGGGVVRIHATGPITVNGTITADGSDGKSSGSQPGGGAGGSIHLVCGRLYGGASGLITAKGGHTGASVGGGGGGGRILVQSDQRQAYYQGAYSVTNGTNGVSTFLTYPSPGTLVFSNVVARGTLFQVM